MENSSLNQAHFQARKAEKLTHQGKFDKAIECHETALSLLSAAITLTDIETVQQSLNYQKEHHLKQVQLLKLKLDYLKQLKEKIMDEKMRLNNHTTQLSETQQEIPQKFRIFQTEIMRTLDEADSALHLHTDSCSSMDPSLNQIMECLRKMRHQLEQMFQLSVMSDNEDVHTDAMKPADEGRYSPSFVSEGDTLNETEMDLPALAPLEVPQFDYAMLSDAKLND